MVSKSLNDCAIGYICEKFGDFLRLFKGTSKCFYRNIFRIELRCDGLIRKFWIFFIECCYIPVLLG